MRLLLVVWMLGMLGLSGTASADAATADARERAVDTATAKRVLAKLVARAAPTRGEARHLDLSIVSLTVDPLGDTVVVSAEVRMAVSGGRGTLLQVFAGGAKVEIPGRSYRAHRLASMREDALTGAVEAVFNRVKRTLQTRELTVAAR